MAERCLGSRPLPLGAQLKRNLAIYYGYNDFMLEAILSLFSPSEAVELMEANEVRHERGKRSNARFARLPPCVSQPPVPPVLRLLAAHQPKRAARVRHVRSAPALSPHPPSLRCRGP